MLFIWLAIIFNWLRPTFQPETATVTYSERQKLQMILWISTRKTKLNFKYYSGGLFANTLLCRLVVKTNFYRIAAQSHQFILEMTTTKRQQQRRQLMETKKQIINKILFLYAIRLFRSDFDTHLLLSVTRARKTSIYRYAHRHTHTHTHANFTHLCLFPILM